MSDTILVTGAQGFVGRYLIAALASQSPLRTIIGIGRSAPRNGFTHHITLGTRSLWAPAVAEFVPWNATSPTYRALDIGDRAGMVELLRSVRPNAIIHLASALRDDPPDHLFRTNVEGTIALLEAIADADIPVERIVLGSSGSVYGEPADTTTSLGEAFPCFPADLYAVSKLAAEHAARVVARGRTLNIVIARIFNIIGAGQDERHVAGRIASQLAAIRPGTPHRLEVGNLTTMRDFIDVRDVAAALMTLLERGQSGATYNVASGVATSIGTIMDSLLHISNLEGRIELVASYRRRDDVSRIVANVAALAELGFRPRFSLPESLTEVYAYYVRAFASA